MTEMTDLVTQEAIDAVADQVPIERIGEAMHAENASWEVAELVEQGIRAAAPMIVAGELDRLIKVLDERAEVTGKRRGLHAEGHADGLHYAGTLLHRRAAELRGEGEDRADG